jgi:hypothetical protein
VPDILDQLVELYHASPTTGDPERTGIYPFRARANPHISKGEGQGRGFYGWLSKEDAIKFALSTIFNKGKSTTGDPVLDSSMLPDIRTTAKGANILAHKFKLLI